MAQSMLEKVADALRAEIGVSRIGAIALARVAIEAMREPGDAVICAVENKAEERYNAAPDMMRWYGEDVWAAGIDAALEKPQTDENPGSS